MVDFKLRQLSLEDEGTNYLLLPKMGRPQIEILARRLEKLGFKLSRGATIVGRKKSETVTVSERGFARSRSDLIDILAPALPELLKTVPAAMSLTSVRGLYLDSFQVKGGAILRFKPRIEALGTWESLRKRGLSGATPDEVQVMRVMIGRTGTIVNALTDYPRDGASVRQLGKRLYFESPVPVDEFVSNLPSVDDKNVRNSYMPKTASLEVRGYRPPSPSDLSLALGALGTWCFFVPKSSNPNKGRGQTKPR